ncbi:MAG: DNA-directed RNA polymerase subunit beta [bacterium]
MNLLNHEIYQEIQKVKSNGKILSLGRWKDYKIPDLPELLNVSKNSFKWFLNEGLDSIFREFFPIETDKYIINYKGYRIGEISEKDLQKCKYEQLTYYVPIYLSLSLTIGKPKFICSKCKKVYYDLKDNKGLECPECSGQLKKELDVIKTLEDEVLFFELPMMTDRGTFIVNGTERVFVNQLIRSPGVYHFKEKIEKLTNYKTTIIPAKGNILDIETDLTEIYYHEREIEKIKSTNFIRVRMDKKIKFTIVALLKALGFSNYDILEELIFNYLAKDFKIKFDKKFLDEAEELLLENNQVENFINEKLVNYIYQNLPENFKKEFSNFEDFSDYFYDKYRFLSHIIQLVVNTIERDIKRNKIFGTDEQEKAIRLLHRRISGESVSNIPLEVVQEQVFPYFSKDKYELSVAGRYKINQKTGYDICCYNCGAINKNGNIECSNCGVRLHYSSVLNNSVKCNVCQNINLYKNISVINDKINFTCFSCGNDLSDKVIVKCILCEKYFKLNEAKYSNNYIICPHCGYNINLKGFIYNEIVNIIKSHFEFLEGKRSEDDINSLSNRRVRPVGEHLYNTLKAGMVKFVRLTKDNLNQADEETVKISEVINPRPVSGMLKIFFAQNSLSQFLDQTNPLSELTHKRRLSTLGIGGIQREQAGFDIRDIHSSHYSRICPVETPEGQNIGLITSLTTYATINYPFGFLVAPYYKVNNGQIDFSKIYYLDASEEENYKIAPADVKFDVKTGKILENTVDVRYKGTFITVNSNEIDYIEISPIQIFSISASLIPFIENDDVNRALMGTNMQRQSVPLLNPEKPLIFTGLEQEVARQSGYCIIAKNPGKVVYVDSKRIVIEVNKIKGIYDSYDLLKFVNTNSATIINQKPLVNLNEEVKEGQIIASGFAIDGDQLALGRNVLVAYMPWEGYNFEDAIIISEEIIRKDYYRSIHIDEEEVVAVHTKQGPEEITREISTVSEEAIKYLDEHGIISVGAYVKPGDILVGKITPHSEVELTAEEKLLQAIFGKSARNAKDTPLKAPPGVYGTVIKVFDFKNENGRLNSSVNYLERVLIHIAQNRNIKVGDKVALRHGNKGVVSVIVPIEDMPFMADGTPIQVILNPLGVPSRMNIGQIFEAHLGLVCKILGIRIKVLPFSNLSLNEIKNLIKEALNYKYKNMLNSNYNYTKYDLLLLLMRDSGYTIKHLVDILNLSKEEIINRLSKDISKEKLEKMEYKQIIKLFTVRDFKEEEIDILYDRIIENLINGKFVLYDGKTGEPFDRPVTVGYVYMMKLIHMVEDKIHARSSGPYSLITQQPLGGRAQYGGQRFGEMEVWALEAYGAAYSLQEMLTIKSDDVLGRNKAYESIVKGKPVVFKGIPESFKVLVKELQALGLDIEIITNKNQPIVPKSFEDFEVEEESSLI